MGVTDPEKPLPDIIEVETMQDKPIRSISTSLNEMGITHDVRSPQTTHPEGSARLLDPENQAAGYETGSSGIKGELGETIDRIYHDQPGKATGSQFIEHINKRNQGNAKSKGS